MRVMMITVAVVFAVAGISRAAEFHVAVKGDDSGDGSQASPFRTIQHAADLAQPGDVITVHEGTYRERVNPLRGGESDAKRIVYRAAAGERVEIKGSEVVKNWVKVKNDTWKVTLPTSFFGDFNPYNDLIHGDWFDPRGRQHHTGAVYLNGEWLYEATKPEEVMAPVGAVPAWLGGGGREYLLNVAWLRPGDGSKNAPRIAATSFAAKQGTQNAGCSEGGECIGFIEPGHWVRYEGIDFGARTKEIEIRAASATEGGTIELRLDAPDGQLLGTCEVPNTGGWQSWASFKTPIKPISGVKTLCLAFKDKKPDGPPVQLWFAQVDKENATIWAQFKGVDPNEQLVEINARRTVFYPEKTGRNYITVRGFHMSQAATPWAPPTAEQIGLIGTNWSKGWIIENNDISYSICSGIALGKHGDQYDNTSANTAEGYVKTIERALANGWNRDTIGHHIVRNNTISHCEQAGIVGSMGPVFSVISGNVIHDIHVRRLFSGAEMAGIKFHGAIDVEISHNHIYRTCLGLWLDWMAQGTHVTGNLFHDNGRDLFVEVDHGPFMVDNNIFLSGATLLDVSEGGAYAHNLMAGQIEPHPDLGRQTPFHKAHSTEVAGLRNVAGGDDRFYNNIFVGGNGLVAYDGARLPMMMDGNVFLKGARPSKHESDAVVEPELDPGLKLVEKADGLYLEFTLGKALAGGRLRELVTGKLLGRAATPSLPYERPDGSPVRVDADYLGRARPASNPTPGPLENVGEGKVSVKVW